MGYQLSLVYFVAEQNISHFYDCACGVHFLDLIHTVWELITPNDNGRNMVKCEGLNLFRFQLLLVL